MEDRIVNLEEKFAHLERYVEELDGVVKEVYERLMVLSEELSRLGEATQQQLAELDRRAEDKEPPHGDSE
jgi:uncharacterized coiled-coil protein SlyX